MQRTDLLVANAQRHEDPLPPVARGDRLLVRAEELRLRGEEMLRLDARALEHRVVAAGCRDRVHRLDQRLEKDRLAGELDLDLAVPVALREDQIRGSQGKRRDRCDQSRRTEQRDARARVERRGERREERGGEEEPRPNR